jgi:uncharacterized membrane protein (UPF0127 family)
MSSVRGRWSRSRSVALFGAALALFGAAGCSGDTYYKPYDVGEETKTWKLGGVDVTLEIADNRAERERGLMFRRNMPENHGMLFVYPEPDELHFWMKNTALPLSIAFIAEDPDNKTATIVNVEDMEPYTELPGAVSLKPVRFALEMNQGWFAKHGLKNGSRIELPSWVGSIVASGDEVGGG